jgi:hypothetical protein
MPSSTLLPTPLPANRPMRCPRPTVRSELMERMPTSSGVVIGARARGLIGTPVRRTRESHSSGPRSSSGCAAPSMMRPSSASPAGIVPAPARGITRASGPRPWLSPVGMRNRRPPANPTTSASMDEPSRALSWQWSPMEAWQPTASRVRPTMRVSVPCSGGAGVRATRWVMRRRRSLHSAGREAAALMGLSRGPRACRRAGRRAPRRGRLRPGR